MSKGLSFTTRAFFGCFKVSLGSPNPTDGGFFNDLGSSQENVQITLRDVGDREIYVTQVILRTKSDCLVHYDFKDCTREVKDNSTERGEKPRSDLAF